MGKTAKRQALQRTLERYISETLSSIRAINRFCAQQDNWSQKRNEEITQMEKIQAEAKRKGFRKFLKGVITGDSGRQGLEKELGDVLKGTLEGIEQLQPFLEAVEKLAVTSLYAFTDDHHLPRGANAADVRSVIKAARMAAPRVIHFKRDDKAFFLPSLDIVEVLACQLGNYINNSKLICETLETREKNSNFSEDSFSEDSNEEFIQEESILDHLKQLIDLRNDPDLRLTFLFQDAAETFIDEFSKRHTRMEQFLFDLEETEKKLNNMQRGASISSVASNSVAVASGICSIVGLALAPVTGGASLALTLTGVGLGVTGGVNSLVTGITDAVVNSRHRKKADYIFTNYKEDMEKLSVLLVEVADSKGSVGSDRKGIRRALEVGKAGYRVGAIAKKIDSLVDGASAVKVLGSKDVVKIGKGFKGTPLALTQAARYGLIGLNVLCIGFDGVMIARESVSLSKRGKNEFAQIIRSRVDLWRSELESWSRIHESLRRGTKSFMDVMDVTVLRGIANLL
ncbi:apolipoprotein L4-like [Alosa sapidissima]|uniref:apolipoprotein L4-like n=1 Tax=Alosa sapidissima TaxID=34773 RepID=UPI001C0A3650|nr:apolipoprotein L4-like [Alosa sapidissima]